MIGEAAANRAELGYRRLNGVALRTMDEERTSLLTCSATQPDEPMPGLGGACKDTS